MNLHEFRSVHGRAQVEVLEIHSHEFGPRCRDGAVDEAFDGGDVSGSCADLAGIVDQVVF
jgi:hypothetical protein